jgi:RNA polymerase sigma-70 factor (ECF subfamily)
VHTSNRDKANGASATGMNSGDQPTLADIYRRYGGEVRAVLLKKLGSPEDADDLTQETFLKVETSGRLESLKNPRAYLLRIADNLVRDRLRRESKGLFNHRQDVTDIDFAHPSPSPEQAASDRAELEALAQCRVALQRDTDASNGNIVGFSNSPHRRVEPRG